jgi:hypothetical protein
MHGDKLEPDPEALKLLPAAIADRLEVIPFFQERRRLQLLCVDPRDVSTLDQVAFVTGLNPDPVVITEIRFWQLLKKHYGIERQLRFVALESSDFLSRTLAEVPPRPGPTIGEDLISEDSFARLYHRRDGFPEVGRAPELPSQAMPLLQPEDLEEIGEAAPGPPGQIERRVWQSPMTTEGRRVEDQVVAALAGAQPSMPPSVAEEESPLDFAQATRLLKEVRGREAISHCVLRFARSVFKRCMLFTIHRGLALGWNALGEDLDPWSFRSLMIPLKEPSVFRLVVDSRAHFLGALTKTPINVQFLRATGKKVPLSVFIAPILVRGRVVNLLYGDNGHKSHSPSDIGDLLILAQAVAQSYEALFDQKKQAYLEKRGAQPTP